MHNLTRTILLVVLLTVFVFAKKNYSGHKVLRFSNVDSYEKLQKLEKYDVWANLADYKVDVHFSPAQLQEVDAIGLPYEMFIEDIEERIQIERMEMAEAALQRFNDPPADFFKAYQQIDQYQTFYNYLTTTYPTLVTQFTLGTTGQGRKIIGLKITGPTNNANKPSIFFNGCQHAREWISPTVTVYQAYKLLSLYSTDATVKKLVDSIVWHIVPVINVDGYIYTLQNRLWRKNMAVNKGSSCIGVDINRNWDYQWSDAGASTNPCDETFHGFKPFTEPEPLAIATYLNNTQNLAAYIDFHSYSQLFMRPWGYTTSLPKDEAILKQLGDGCADAIYSVNKVRFASGNIARIIYVASGSSADWVYGVTRAWGYGVELRDTGQHGFILPAAQIIPSGEEIFASTKFMGNFVLKNYQPKN